MNKKEYLQIVTKQIRFRFDRDAIGAELSQHLMEIITLHTELEQNITIAEPESGLHIYSNWKIEMVKVTEVQE